MLITSEHGNTESAQSIVDRMVEARNVRGKQYGRGSKWFAFVDYRFMSGPGSLFRSRAVDIARGRYVMVMLNSHRSEKLLAAGCHQKYPSVASLVDDKVVLDGFLNRQSQNRGVFSVATDSQSIEFNTSDILILATY